MEANVKKTGKVAGGLLTTVATLAANAVVVEMGEPVVIAQSGKNNTLLVEIPTTGANEWGRYRCPMVFRLPSGDIGLTFSVCLDHYMDQGRKGPLFVSKDNGKTWTETHWPAGIPGTNIPLSPVFDGEHLCYPIGTGLRVDEEAMPPAAGALKYGGPSTFNVFRLADCPDRVKAFYNDTRILRWTPATGAWTEERVAWGDHKDQLVFTYNDAPQNIPGNWTQKFSPHQRFVLGDGEIYVADYWSVYLNADGSAPVSWPASLMVSKDNGRTWERRGFIASDASGGPDGSHYAEPGLAMNQKGELVCVMRDGNGGRPLLLTHSKDKGRTWDKPVSMRQIQPEFHNAGVLPQLLQLANGVLVLTYGRAPSTWAAFSLDGGHTWTKPHAVNTEAKTSCGYTCLLPLDDETLLVAYGDVEMKNPDGDPCKTILARTLTVKPD